MPEENNDTQQFDHLAEQLWNFLTLHQQPQKSDAIVALGSYDLNVPKWAAKLYHEKYAPFIVMSGGKGRLTPEQWQSTEAEKFAEIAIEEGVPEEKILLDAESTITRDNVINSLAILKIHGISTNQLLVVTFPFHEKRAHAFFQKYSPQTNLIFSAPPTTFQTYPNENINKEELIHILVGEVLRLVEYTKREYITPVEVPTEILDSAEQLKDAGFNKYTTF